LRKQKRDPQKTKKKLLDTAERVFVKKGYTGARVDEIANEADVNKRMIYVWFGNKEALYLEVLKTAFMRLFKSSKPELAPGDDPVTNTEAMVRWYFGFLSRNPSFVRLLAWETLNDGHRAGKVLVDLMEEGLGPLHSIIKDGKARGLFRQDLAAHKIVTMINEMCLGYFNRLRLLEVLWDQDLNHLEKQEEMLNHILQILFAGIRNRQENA